MSDTSLQGLTNLTELSLESEYRITDNGIQVLTNIRTLELSSAARVSEKALYALPNLTCLSILFSTCIKGTCLRNLLKLQDLTLRGINEQHEVDYDSFGEEAIKDLSNLTSLTIDSCSPKFTCNSFMNLTRLTNLRVSHPLVGMTKELAHVLAPSLTRFYCGGWNNYTVNLEGLRDLVNLRYLDISSLSANVLMKDEDVQCLTNLEILLMSCNNQVTDQGIKNLTNLTELYPCGAKISNEGVKNLVKLHTIIPFADTDITEEVFKFLPNLNHVKYH